MAIYTTGHRSRLWPHIDTTIARPDLVGATVAALVVFFITRDVWGDPHGIIDAWDASAVTARTDAIVYDILATGRLDGWVDTFFAGHDATLFNGPGFAVVVGLLSLLSFGAIDTVAAISLITVVAFAALPFSVAYTAGRYDADPEVAGLCAIGSLGVTFFAGVGIQGAFESGLLLQHLAAPFAVASIGSVVELVRRPSDHAARVAGLLVGATALIHPVSITTLVLIFALVVLVEIARGTPVDRPLLRRVPHAALIATGLAAVWLIPAIAHRAELGAAAAFGQPDFGKNMADILGGEVLLVGFLGPAVLLGSLACALVPTWRRVAGPPVLVAIGYVVSAHVIRGWWPDDLTVHLTLRGLGYVSYLALIAPAVVTAGVLRRIARPQIALLCGAAIVAAAVLQSTSVERSSIGTHPQGPIELRQAAAVLAAELPDWGRAAVDQSWEARERYGVESIPHWLAATAGVSTVNGFNPEVAASSVDPVLREIDVGSGLQASTDSATALDRLGVTHLVALSPDAPSWNIGSPIFESDRLRVNELDSDFLSVSGGVDGHVANEVIDYSPGHVEAVVDAQAPARLIAAVGYSPRWDIRVDGESAPLTRSPEGLVAFDLPAGEHTIELDHRLDGPHHAGMAITAFTALALSFAATRRRLSRN